MNRKSISRAALALAALCVFLVSFAHASGGKGEAVKLTLGESAVIALKNNKSLAVKRLGPEIAGTAVEKAMSVFDPVLSGQIAYARQSSSATGAVDGMDLSLSASKAYETGTKAEIALDSSLRHQPLTDASRLTLTVTQALLKGYGTEINTLAAKAAGLDARISAYELRAAIADAAASAQTAYLDFFMANERVAIADGALAVSKSQESEIEEKIRLGKFPEVEIFGAKAEVARREEDRIKALAAVERARLALARALGLKLDTALVCADSPEAGKSALDAVDDHAELALKTRPDLNQARLSHKKGELEVIRTKDGILPKMDGFIKLGRSGYARSFGGSYSELDGGNYDVTLGLSGQIAVGNRSALMDGKKALLTADQLKRSLENMSELAEFDVRSAHVDAQRLLDEMPATRATLKFMELSHDGEKEKMRVGRSTSLMVAMAARDLTSARISELEARVNYMKAAIELYRRDGSLLRRLGVEAPGSETAGE